MKETICILQDSVGSTFLKLQDDNHSQTSGETNTSDSGRGLSDDENHVQNGNHGHQNGHHKSGQSFQNLKGTEINKN